MNYLKKSISFLLVLVMLLSVFQVSIIAASVSFYQTNKADVPIWSSASSKSSKVRVVSSTGTVLRVVGSTTNSSGNLWYKLNDGYWVFSGNVKKHSHSYTGGICNGIGCGYEWQYSVSSYNGTYVVSNSSGAKIWSRPYSNKSSHIKTAGYGTVVNVIAKTTNNEGNLWYKTSDGYWVYSGNVTRRFTVSYSANGGNGAPGMQYVLSGNYLSIPSTKPIRGGYIFKGWATSSGTSSVAYKPGSSYKFSSDVTLYAVWAKCTHSDYKGGYCTTCGYQWQYAVSSYSGTFTVTNSDGAKIWSRPYSNNSNHIRTDSKGAVLNIVGKTTNQEGNLWYKLSDGYWVYSGNVTQRFTVSYNANGGSGAPGAQYVLSGNSLKLSSSKPTRTGYIFKGWSTSAGSSKVTYKGGSSYKFSSNVTLYAVWAKCTHSDYKGGICTQCGYEYPLNTSTFNGTFAVTNSNGAKIWSKPYSTGSSKHIKTSNKNTVLSVVGKVKNSEGNIWYKLSDGYWVYSGNVTQRFAVSYSANGGSGAPKGQTVLSGNSLTLSKSTPARVGYIFKGWATSASSSKATHKGGSSYKFSSSVTLYAVWSKCPHSDYKGGICTVCKYEYPLNVSAYKATFVVTNKNGAKIWSKPYSTGSSKHIKTSNINTVLSVVGKVKNSEGNIWYKLSDGYWVYSGNVTHRFSVKYNANGGSGAPGAQYVLSGNSLKLSSSKPTRIGYIFKGWSTSASSSKVTHKGGSSYKFSSNVTLYAVWAKCSHSDYKGGICTVCKYEYPLNVSTLKGTFVVTNSNGAKIWSKPYSTGSSKHIKTNKKNAVLSVVGKVKNAEGNTWYKLSDGYWVYSKNVTQRFTVKYNANGGYSAPGSQTFLSGKKVELSKNEPYRFGYEFKGWATSKSSEKVIYKPGSKYSEKSNVTLYAVWKEYDFLNTSIAQNSKSAFKVPGLEDGFIPQGLCYIEKLGMYAISGYFEDGKKDSRIYLVNKQTGEIRKFILTGKTFHAGGIASNGDDVWVSAGGDETKGGYIYHTTVEKLTKSGSLKFDGKFQTQVKGSALYCDGKTLWVCEFYKSGDKDYAVNKSHKYGDNRAWACGYKLPVTKSAYNSKERVPDVVLSIPDKVQGMCITDDGNVVFSTSHGRSNKSKLLVYKPYKKWTKYNAKVGSGKVTAYAVSESSLIASITMPVLMEGLDYHNGKMYIVFESGAKKYSDAKNIIPYVWETDIKKALKKY